MSPLISQDQPQGFILSYFFKHLRVLSLSRMLAEFSLTCIFHHVWEKYLNSWCSHSQKIHWIQAFLLMLPSSTQNSRQNFLKIGFPEQQKGVENTVICFIKIKSKNMKMASNIRLFTFCMICKFSKRDGLTVL